MVEHSWGKNVKCTENALMINQSQITFFKYAVLENGGLTGGQQIQLFIKSWFESSSSSQMSILQLYLIQSQVTEENSLLSKKK